MTTRRVARLGFVAAGIIGSLVLGACGGEDPPAATTTGTPTGASNRPVTARATDPAWHYEGENGPANWGRLDARFAACGEGRAQSPIDFADVSRGSAPELKTTFPRAELRVVHHEHMADGINNGHTIQINYPAADTLSLGGTAYQLVQYHFHAPSEHTVNGVHFPMEMHLVHKASDGRLAVVGTFIKEGAANRAFEPIWSNLPAQKGSETHYPAVSVDVDALLPTVRTTYRYDGSLTTPPCSEAVSWIVMSTPIELSAEQIGAFTRLIDGNNRPVQPLNGRPVVSDAVTVSRR